MTWQEVLSITAAFIMQIIIVFFSYLFAYFMDYDLYKANKYNESRKTKIVGCKWLIRCCKKDNMNEIFILALVHEIISIILFAGIIAEFILFILSVMNINLTFIVTIILFLYMAYCATMEKIVQKK